MIKLFFPTPMPCPTCRLHDSQRPRMFPYIDCSIHISYIYVPIYLTCIDPHPPASPFQPCKNPHTARTKCTAHQRQPLTFGGGCWERWCPMPRQQTAVTTRRVSRAAKRGSITLHTITSHTQTTPTHTPPLPEAHRQTRLNAMEAATWPPGVCIKIQHGSASTLRAPLPERNLTVRGPERTQPRDPKETRPAPKTRHLPQSKT